jgi:radical SAM protein with 4Fe4S-binding SPASM domain
MTDEIFLRIIDNIKHGKNCNGGGVRFIRWGEPALHPKLVEYIRLVKEVGWLCHINTNGTLLNDALIKELLDSELDSIKFSFQGTDEASYQEMRQGGRFKELIEHIEKFHKMREERGKSLPYIHIATTTTYETEEDAITFKESVKGFCDLVTVGRTKMEHIDIEKTELSEAQKSILAELKEKETLVKKRFSTCPEVFGKLSIDWDGQATACCGDYNREMIVGHIQDHTIKEIFKNEKMERYREMLGKREFHKIPHCSCCFDLMDIQLCANAVVNKSFNKDNIVIAGIPAKIVNHI